MQPEFPTSHPMNFNTEQKHGVSRNRNIRYIFLCVGIVIGAITLMYILNICSNHFCLNTQALLFRSTTVEHQTNEEQSVQDIASKTPPTRISLLFLGDIMLDRGVRSNINKIGADAVFVDFTKKQSDAYTYTIANLEGPITTWPSQTIDATGKGIPGFTFTFPTSSAIQLKQSGIDIVSLANNHTENFGQEGMKQTQAWLAQAGVAYVGTPDNSSLSHTVCETICISFIGYNEFTYTDNNALITEIKTMRQTSDLVILIPHWGVEYEHLPTQKHISLAHSWIDAGADAIIGMHPHVIQSFELYHHRPIFYSLGNYLFDQYFSYDTTHGLAVGLEYETSDAITLLKNITLIPIDNTRLTTKTPQPADSERILRSLYDRSITFVPAEIAEHILRGNIPIPQNTSHRGEE